MITSRNLSGEALSQRIAVNEETGLSATHYPVSENGGYAALNSELQQDREREGAVCASGHSCGSSWWIGPHPPRSKGICQVQRDLPERLSLSGAQHQGSELLLVWAFQFRCSNVLRGCPCALMLAPETGRWWDLPASLSAV